MLAVIETGGKQYVVGLNDLIKTETIKGKKEGDKVVFDRVLLLENEGRVEIGTPYLKKAKVTGTVVEQGRSKKLIVFKYKPKTRYKVKKGHRQSFTKVKIEKIEG
jgi:large subunit ribosomal protein L21